ncbi:MAG TPA: phosphodiester glycosidase family protein [Candidatus Limnocylindrales bacterium]
MLSRSKCTQWTVILALTLTASTATASPATAAPVVLAEEAIASGVQYSTIETTTARGVVRGHVIVADLRNPAVDVDLVTAGAVAARAPLSQQVQRAGAIAGVNGDFFNISNTQPGVEVTGSASGPAIEDGRDLKAAVPTRQRFGPSFPPGASIEHVIGVGVDRVGRIARLSLTGKAFGPGGRFDLNGLNQYALPQNGIGVYNSDWGTVSRKRATCGSDTNRSAPCTAETFEVTVHHGKVIQSSVEPGSGPIPDDAIVLLGREAGAATLGRLSVGDPVTAHYGLGSVDTHVPFRFAVGGFPVLDDSAPMAGVEGTVAAVRTGAGFSADGHTLYLYAVDGRSPATLTLLELAVLMKDLGAADAVNLDGGGSTTMVTRPDTTVAPVVRNNPSGGVERIIPDGIGIFSTPAAAGATGP